MIVKYGLFDSAENDIREYAEADLAMLVRALSENGVRGGLDALKVTPRAGDLAVDVAPGFAIVQGRYFALEDDGSGAMTLALARPTADSRIDRVVLKLNYSHRTIGLAVISGTEAAAPEPPVLTRTAAEYMISLAQIRVRVGVSALDEADITDERSDWELCGLFYVTADEALERADKAAEAAAAAKKTADSGVTAAAAAQKTANSGVAAAQAAQKAADEKAAVSVLSLTLTAGGWSTSAPYTQTVTVSGLKETDMPVADVDMSSATADTAAEIQGAYALIGRMTTEENKFTAYCYEEKPEMALKINLIVVR